jgi:dephospho-CoA kinase
MLRIGLTGGIGAGKSTVSNRLVELGATLVDADRIAREVVAPGTPGLAEVAAEFGEDVLAGDGSLDRPALAAVVFSDESARARLNGIVHPLVGRRTEELIASAPADAIVVQDIPLLVEGSGAASFPLVVVVNAPVEVRVRRLLASRDMTEQDARARIAAQAREADRRAVADVWLDNSGDPDALRAGVDRLHGERLVPFEAGLRRGEWAEPAGGPVERQELWAGQFGRAAARIARALRVPGGVVHHVGATAVPGMAAPDLVEVAAEVAPGTDPGPALHAVGLVPGDGGYRSADPGCPLRLRLYPPGDPSLRTELQVRDWLRAEPAVRARYAGGRVAAGGPGPRGTGAGEWPSGAEDELTSWVTRTGWRPPGAPAAQGDTGKV